MSEYEKHTDFIEFQGRIRKKYLRISLIFFILGIMLILWTFIVFLGVYIWNYNNNWVLTSLENWIFAVSIIIVILILFEIIFYTSYSSLLRRKFMKDQPVEYINGKKVHIYTTPKGIKGGIFSKTYIEIDEHNLLRLRTLMIPPGELWGKKE